MKDKYELVRNHAAKPVYAYSATFSQTGDFINMRAYNREAYEWLKELWKQGWIKDVATINPVNMQIRIEYEKLEKAIEQYKAELSYRDMNKNQQSMDES